MVQVEKSRMPNQQDDNIFYLEITVDIVSAYVLNNPVPAGELAKLISDIHSKLRTLAAAPSEAPSAAATRKPAVSINRSVQPDHLVCLEDGKKFLSLKRHLRASHGMSPEDYRSKWNLPPTYPMTAASYSEKRSVLAKEFGLGRSRPAPPAPAPSRRKKK